MAWTARQHSDLDLALMTEEPLDIMRVADLREAFTKSDLPFRVDIVDWASASENFREIIEKEYVIVQDRINEQYGWHEFTIGEIADVVGGGTPSTKEPDNFDGGIPWLTPKDLSGIHDRYIGCGERNLSQKGLKNSSAKLLPAGSVLLSTRAPIGYVALAKNPIATNQGFHSLLVKEGFSPEYLYYWLIQNTEELKRHASGSTFGELSGSALKTIQLKLPPLKKQRTITHILGTLDDKIELNRKMSETLEAMVQVLFKSWFVDFDPVRAKMEGQWCYGESLPGLPADIWDLFPNRMVKSEMGKTPEGWTTGNIADIAVSPRRGVNPTDLREETPYIGLEHMPRQSVALMEWGKAKNVTSNKSSNILFGKLRPYFHKVGIAPVDGICSTDILVVVPKATEWSSFLLACVSSDEFIKYADQTSTGTKMPRTSWNIIGKYQVCLPTVAVAQAFHNVVNVFLNRIVANIHESRSLIALRNVLLPKLVSGKLNVINF